MMSILKKKLELIYLIIYQMEKEKFIYLIFYELYLIY